MTTLTRAACLALLIPAIAVPSGCAVVQRPPEQTQHIFVIDAEFAPPPARATGDATLVVTPPRAAPGIDTPRIAYAPQATEIRYYAASQWAETPARMLEPLLIRALESTGAFRAVVGSASPAAGDLRLDSELLRLQQDFTRTPSEVRVSVRVQVMDLRRREVLATRVFEVREPAPSDDAPGGVAAFNRAMQVVLEEIGALAGEIAQGLP
jgi:cholesterol transport system auxiliary component